MLVMGIPLALRLVPRNPVFGFKISWTLADDEIWYAANAAVGRYFVVFGCVLGLHALSLWKGVYAWRWGALPLLLIILVGLVGIFARGFSIARRMAREKDLPWDAPGRGGRR